MNLFHIQIAIIVAGLFNTMYATKHDGYAGGLGSIIGCILSVVVLELLN